MDEIRRLRKELQKLRSEMPLVEQRTRMDFYDKDFYDKMLERTVFLRVEYYEPINGKSYNSIGSGVIISKHGHILTCDHILNRSVDPEGALLWRGNIEVKLFDGTNLKALFISKDPEHDLGLLKAVDPRGEELNNLQVASLAKPEEIKIGMSCYMISNPDGNKFSFADGTISHNRRHPHHISRPDLKKDTVLIQTNLASYGGSSGGPIFDLQGEIMGVHILGSGDGFEFGVQSETVMEFLKPHRHAIFEDTS